MTEPQARIVLRPSGSWEVEVAEQDVYTEDWKAVICMDSIADLVAPLESLIESLQELHRSIKPYAPKESTCPL